MKIRQFRNIECVKLHIDGAGIYHLPQTAFKNEKIDSLLFFALKDNNTDYKFQQGMLENLNNLFVDIFSVEKKPLYVNIPLLSFRIDNLMNRVEEKLDFDLTKITYTGSEKLILYIYFSIDERIIEFEDAINQCISTKSLNYDYNTILDGVAANGYNYHIFDDDTASYFMERKSKKINIENATICNFYNITFTSGKSLVKIPTLFFHQSVFEPSNLVPFIIDDTIDLFRSNIDISEPFVNTSQNPFFNPNLNLIISSNK
jgi:hypothetical protein